MSQILYVYKMLTKFVFYASYTNYQTFKGRIFVDCAY